MRQDTGSAAEMRLLWHHRTSPVVVVVVVVAAAAAEIGAGERMLG